MSRQTPYAPTSSIISPPLASNISLDEEVKLYTTSAKREIYEDLAELYSIIVSLEFLEKAYTRDTVNQAQYATTCQRLLTQYKSILKTPEVAAKFKDIDTFMNGYKVFGSFVLILAYKKVSYSSASYRLKIGVPVTVEHAGADSVAITTGTSAKEVAEAVQVFLSSVNRLFTTKNFITFMDALKLKYSAKDQLHPLLSDLITSLNNVTVQEFQGRSKIVNWLIKLNQMNAADEITEEQSRQMLFDIEQAYNEFFKGLSS
ncbi:Vacuolar protein sorting-associated protein 28 2 [Neolecta irregularis DAH-3]|uniref:Vacuolar protein sorting-associated protein 28 n=1 Tax=Neolecta irregularis (strain DAH-3) TaxID=1198029 RepID=A0A1U7LWY9_NEOID|nr:Vacuolar protein sorting-associated protein 28 2 [Neolecta irregularis DAH-3]|eukprot:OLL27139.1 Vacuolar protein sorting-associated protein 28 2 [Neolecta irregularis DAH-3]